MKTVTVRLTFPLKSIQEPVVTHLVKDFDVSPNVLAAEIEAGKGGWMMLGLSGQESDIEDALRWVESVGIGAEPQNA